MIYKPRTESIELQVLEYLQLRMDISDKDLQYSLNLKKGLEGEMAFDALIDNISCECIILNDLLLKQNNNLFQIDSLIIISDTIYLFEIKNFDGDYYYDSERLYKKPQTEINDPLVQLNRTDSLFRQLLQSFGFHFKINPFIVFINPEFTLYQAPLNKPFIFPTQLHNLFKKLNTIPSAINNKHKRLAEKLEMLHIKDSPYKQLPAYNYNQLQKGITCKKCYSFFISVEGKRCICKECGYEEFIASAVMRNVKEFQLLFPEQRITTNTIHEWCKVVESKRTIRRVLEKNFHKKGVRQWTYYE